MTFCNPVHRPYTISRGHAAWRKLGFLIGFVGSLGLFAAPALAQTPNNSNFALRDTETEELLNSYEAPLARAAGLDVSNVHVYLLGDLEVNAFATQPEDIMIFAGIMMFLKSPNELIGVMAHETGHLAAGHLSRSSDAISKAEIPMMLSMIVGIAAMIAGAGAAGGAIMALGQSIAEGQFNRFSRVQEFTADQIALKLLLATHQSPMGMVHTFQRFADEEARAAEHMDPYAVDHPTGQDRVAAVSTAADTSPYRDVPDSPQSVHAFQMVQAKLAGFILPVDEALRRYPVTDNSEPAHYARAMAYMRKPELQKALDEINGLIQQEPNNPYFYEVLGQIHLMMAKPLLSIPAYQKAVDLKPTAPQLRLSLATAQLATDNVAYAQPALTNLKVALLTENEDIVSWEMEAQAYSMLKNNPMADLSTAEAAFHAGDLRQALVFSSRARRNLTQGTSDWQRANDIIGAAAAGAGR